MEGKDDELQERGMSQLRRDGATLLINNGGTEAQIRHLRKAGWGWNTIREAIGLEPWEEKR